MAGIYLELRFWDGAAWSTHATAITGNDGRYQFLDAPGLGTDQVYCVLYRNGRAGNANNPNYLWLWLCRYITSYSAGATLPGGDFDIANIFLVSPNPGASVTLPATFRWTRRSVTADSYRLVLYYADLDEIAFTNLLGYVDGVTITSIPPTWPSGASYRWWIEAHYGDGQDNYGQSYYNRVITISYSSEAGEDDSALSPTIWDLEAPGFAASHGWPADEISGLWTSP